MSKVFRTWFFLSAFSPCLISIGISRFIYDGFSWTALYYCIGGALGTLSSLYILQATRWYTETFPFSAKKVESNDALMISVFATYIVPFIGRAASLTIDVVLAIVAAAFIILWFQSSILPSPVIRALGYRFYKVESESGIVYTILSDKEILDPKDILNVKRLSSSMLMVA